MKLLPVAANILFVISTILIAYSFRKFVPTEINPLFGYRTRRSMSSQAAWSFANQYAADLLFKCAMFVAGIQLILLFIVPALAALLSGVGLLICALVLTLIKTEKQLKLFLESKSKSMSDN